MVDVSSIKAIGVTQAGGIEVLKELTIPKPKLEDYDIFVQIKANALNPVDYKVRRGANEASESNPKIPGYDASGVVVELGAKVTNFKLGDEVFYAGNIRKPGNYADYHVIDSRIVGKKPTKMSHADAAGIPLVFLTAYEGMIDRMGIPLDKEANKDKSILIVPGAGGVGSIAIQIAKQVLGLTVIGTASREETKEFAKKMGADHMINHRNNLKEELEKIGIKQIDYAFHTWDLTTEYCEQLCDVLRPFGKLGFITQPPKQDFSCIKLKCITLVPELMFTRPIFGVELERQGEILNIASKMIDEGKILSTVTQVSEYNLENIRKGNEVLEHGKSIGKISLNHD